jgi:thiol-disulfide isomerase/thioredoxin
MARMIGHRPIPVAACLLAALLAPAGPGRADDGPGTFAELKRAHERESEALDRRRGEAKTEADRAAVQAEVWEEVNSAAARALAWAESHRDDPESIDAIIWTVHGLANGYYAEYADKTARAYELLAERALADERVAPVCYYSGGIAMACPQGKRFLEAALEKSPSRLIRGASCLALARDERTIARHARKLRDPIMSPPLLEKWSKSPEVLKMLKGEDPDAHDRRALEYFDRVIAEFGDVKMPAPYNEKPFAELARGEAYALTHLVLGKPAPELRGEDVRGGEVRLGDYRGKVVAIVFWATWCNPCMEMVPHERKLAGRMEGRPFVLLGVNGDDDRDKATKVMGEQSMTWPSVWNGGHLDGIVTAWGVRAWPTIYVLDAEGIIRYDSLQGEDLDKAVDRLVEEAEAARK